MSSSSGHSYTVPIEHVGLARIKKEGLQVAGSDAMFQRHRDVAETDFEKVDKGQFISLSRKHNAPRLKSYMYKTKSALYS
jgi:hypothetical protein